MQRVWTALGLAASLAGAAPASAAICPHWSTPQRVGQLDIKVITEASGIAASRRFAGRLYHNNDSGDGPKIYVTDRAGGRTRTATIPGFTPIDVEDIALGPCAGAPSCLFVGDIGDNFARRPSVTIVELAEVASFDGEQRPLRTVSAKYPDGAHDAESLGVHPNGDLFVITKPIDFVNRRAGVAQVYRLTAAQLAAGGEQAFEKVGEIDLPYLLYENGLAGQLATGLDIAPDGSRFILITYQSAMEVGFDLSKPLPPSHSWVPAKNYVAVPIAALPQAEAIAYTPDGLGFLYTTEYTTSAALAPIHVASQGQAPLYRQTCRPQPPR